MKHITKVLAIILVLAISFQLAACSCGKNCVKTDEAATDTAALGPATRKISISTISPKVDGEGYETHTETYSLEDAVGIQPVDYEDLYVIADNISLLQDLTAYELEEITVLYIDPALVEEYLFSEKSMETFFGFSTDDLQKEYGNVALSFASDGTVTQGITIVPVEESSSANPYDYKSFFSKLAVGCGIIVIGATLSVATGGGTFTCAMVAISKAALSSAVIAGAVTSTYYTAKGVSQGKTVAEAFEESCEAGLDSFADGFVIGSIIGSVYTLGHPTCFVAGTPVATPTGSEPIESLAIGDSVFTKNMETGSVDQQPVLNTFVSETHELITLKLSNQDTAIMTTPSHPFYSPVKGWTAAAVLRVGDLLVTLNGDLVVVEQVQHELLESPVTVFNIETASNHNYFVGDSDTAVLVHNRCNINSQYAGKTKYFEDGTEMAKKYPDGVAFSSDGYARFEPYAKVKITFENGALNGNYAHDFKLANDYMGLGNKVSATPAGYTWHHVEDGKTLLLVPQDLHSAVRHTGGASILRGGGN